MRMQPAAFGAQDRGDVTVFLCCAPSAAADAQAVRRLRGFEQGGD
jgi:hypothetical protein